MSTHVAVQLDPAGSWHLCDTDQGHRTLCGWPIMTRPAVNRPRDVPADRRCAHPGCAPYWPPELRLVAGGA